MIFSLIFPVIEVPGDIYTYTIKRLDFNGTELGDVKRGFKNFICLAVDIIGNKFFPTGGGCGMHDEIINNACAGSVSAKVRQCKNVGVRFPNLNEY